MFSCISATLVRRKDLIVNNCEDNYDLQYKQFTILETNDIFFHETVNKLEENFSEICTANALTYSSYKNWPLFGAKYHIFFTYSANEQLNSYIGRLLGRKNNSIASLFWYYFLGKTLCVLYKYVSVYGTFLYSEYCPCHSNTVQYVPLKML
jgi:hypothetical protein